MKKSGIAAVAMVAVVGVLAGCASTPTTKGSGPDRLQVVNISGGGTQLIFFPSVVANDEGFFKREGVLAQLTTVQAGSTDMAALLGGDVQMVLASTDTFLGAVAQGAKLVAVDSDVGMTEDVCASTSYMAAHGVTPRSTVQEKMAAFKGATLGATGAGGTSSYNLLAFMLEKYGHLNPHSQVNLVSVGSATAQVAGLENGSIQGFMISPPGCQEVAATGKGEVLVTPADVAVWKGYIHEVLFTTSSYARAHPKVVAAVAKAYALAQNFMVTNTAITERLIYANYLGVPHSLLNSAFTEDIVPEVSKSGLMTEAEWAHTIAVEKELGTLPVSASISSAAGGIWSDTYLKSGG